MYQYLYVLFMISKIRIGENYSYCIPYVLNGVLDRIFFYQEIFVLCEAATFLFGFRKGSIHHTHA